MAMIEMTTSNSMRVKAWRRIGQFSILNVVTDLLLNIAGRLDAGLDFNRQAYGQGQQERNQAQYHHQEIPASGDRAMASEQTQPPMEDRKYGKN